MAKKTINIIDQIKKLSVNDKLTNDMRFYCQLLAKETLREAIMSIDNKSSYRGKPSILIEKALEIIKLTEE